MNPTLKWHDPTKELPEQDWLILVVAGPKKGNIKNRNYKRMVYTGVFNQFGKAQCWQADGAGFISPQHGKFEKWKIHAWAYIPGFEPPEGTSHEP